MLEMENTSKVRVIDTYEDTNNREMPFYMQWMCAHVYAMRQRKALDNNE